LAPGKIRNHTAAPLSEEADIQGAVKPRTASGGVHKLTMKGLINQSEGKRC
jgi:hypothetical protein